MSGPTYHPAGAILLPHVDLFGATAADDLIQGWVRPQPWSPGVTAARCRAAEPVPDGMSRSHRAGRLQRASGVPQGAPTV